MSEKQIKLLQHYAYKSGIELETIIQRIDEKKVTISEIVSGILGIRI